MVDRIRYALPIDVLRRVDSSIAQADIGSDYDIPVSSDTITAHIEGVEKEFERRALELTDQTKSEELHEGIERDFGWTVYLNEVDVKPLDSSQGDLVELRTGEDTWTDVTDDAFLDPRRGVIEVENRTVRQFGLYYPDDTNYHFRVTYRYGASADESGETNLTSSITDAESTPITANVTDASEIEVGSVVLVGASEYFFVSDRDETNDTITLNNRAIRGTTAVSHSSGDTVIAIPLDIRDAISAKVATRILRQDDFLDTLTEGAGDAVDTQQKIEDLDEEFENTIARYSTSSGYV